MNKTTFMMATSLLVLCTGPALCKLTRLHNQNNKGVGSGVVSQNFTSGSSADTSAAADDFVVPTGHTWKIKKVTVTGGYYNGSGPASSENVLFYKSKNALPGNLVAECDDLQGADNQGSFTITIPRTCTINLTGRGTGAGTTYWVSVVANVDSNCCGVWEWELRILRYGNEATWENPANGYGTGCTTWNYLQYCFPNVDQDLMWALYGTDQ